MPSELDKMVMEERFAAIPSVAPAHLVKCGQRWINDKPHCYKCQNFRSNKHTVGTCQLAIIKGDIVSQDFSRGDFCNSEYAPIWTLETGLIPAQNTIKDQ